MGYLRLTLSLVVGALVGWFLGVLAALLVVLGAFLLIPLAVNAWRVYHQNPVP